MFQSFKLAPEFQSFHRFAPVQLLLRLLENSSRAVLIDQVGIFIIKMRTAKLRSRWRCVETAARNANHGRRYTMNQLDAGSALDKPFICSINSRQKMRSANDRQDMARQPTAHPVLVARPHYMVPLLATVTVLAHTVIVLLHGAAHQELNVALSLWQKNYAASVILLAPIVAAVLLWTRHGHTGFLLLTASMAGSLIFGLYYHYVAVSADHVSHIPPGDAQGLFRLTALLLTAPETFGSAVGIMDLRTASGKLDGQ
jgi:hypothetical protein